MIPNEDDASGERTFLLNKTCESNGPGQTTLTPPAALVLTRSRRLLYVSHFFNQFSENAWQFCLVLFLAAFSNYQSLFLVSSYGFVTTFAVFYFGSTTGRYIDGTDRFVVARRFLFLENSAVILATVCCWILLSRPTTGNGSNLFQGVPTDFLSIFLISSIHILGAGARTLDSGFLVAVERDWVVAMSMCLQNPSQDDTSERTKKQRAWLSTTNVTMKQIDLSCKIVAPAASGMLVALLGDANTKKHGSDLQGAAVFVGGLNSLALIVEYLCMARIYSEIPTLSEKRLKMETSAMPPSLDPSINVVRTQPNRLKYFLSDGLRVYFEQEISLAGLALALLYVNVLTFGGIMTAYLVWRGMRTDAIGVWRGVSSAIGLAGTFVYQFMSTRMTLAEVGMSSIVFQFLCLSLSYASLFLSDLGVSMTMLITGVCASRVGLWVFDITVTQLMQFHIPDDSRGLVGGVQQSLNSFFGLFSFALGLVLSDPRDFQYFVAVGYFSVGIAVACFGFGIFSKREQLAP